MKSFIAKRFFRYLFILSLFNSYIYAASVSPEFNIFMNLGLSYTFIMKDVNYIDQSYYDNGVFYSYYDSIQGNINVDYKAFFQGGVSYDISNKIVQRASTLLEFGYSPLIINTKYYGGDGVNKYLHTDRMIFHSVLFGIVEKIYMGKFNIGLGFGILLPTYGHYTSTNPFDSLLMLSQKKLKFWDIKDLFEVPVAPYVKLTAEYGFNPFKFESLDMYILLGVYVNYNFGMKYNVSFINQKIASSTPYGDNYKDVKIFNDYRHSNLDFGFTIGLSFKPATGDPYYI